jgi:hypothetical protein
MLCAGDGAIIAGLALLLVWFRGRAQPEEPALLNNQKTQKGEPFCGFFMRRGSSQQIPS